MFHVQNAALNASYSLIRGASMTFWFSPDDHETCWLIYQSGFVSKIVKICV